MFGIYIYISRFMDRARDLAQLERICSEMDKAEKITPENDCEEEEGMDERLHDLEKMTDNDVTNEDEVLGRR